MLRTLRNQNQREDEGFTLIELLVVVIIIGILAAIAIPVFLNQREKARNASANSDLRNLVTAQEAYFTEEDNYTTSAASLETEGLTRSSEVWLCIATYDNADAFRAETWHPGGTNYYYFDSKVGQIDKNDAVQGVANCTQAPA